MAQPSPAIEANGASASPQPLENGDSLLAGKRKREESDDAVKETDVMMEDAKSEGPTWAPGDQKGLIQSYYQVLTRYDSYFFESSWDHRG